MYIVNFDDPERSHRFNPISPEYLTRPADCSDIAELIMFNACKLDGNDDFFTKSAVCYVDLLIWFLKIYDNGRYCTFPHMVYLMAYNYIDVFDMIQKFGEDVLELQIKMVAFVDAIRDKAKDQLQGQLASARIPLAKFCDPGLAWILTGNDFNLKINDPDEPKFVAVGNNPERQNTYGAALALMTARMFSIINKPGRLNDEEFATIKSHSSIGFDILKNMTEVEDIQFGARWHHERYDGKGYPDGLKGEEIPEYARIIATADAYDAMTSNRSYRDALPQAKVREELLAGRGTQFDPKIADIMIQLIDEDPNYEMRQKDDEKCI